MIGAAAPILHASEKELDDAVIRIERAKKNAFVSMWQLGNELHNVHEKKLWKLRLDVKGKPRYSSFDRFVETELRFSHTHAYSLIDIAKNFTEDDVAKLGTSKLSLLLKVDAKDRSLLKAKAEAMSKRQLKEAADEIVKQGGGSKTRSSSHSAAGKLSAMLKAAKSKRFTITLDKKKHTVKMREGKGVLQLGAVTIHLTAKGTSTVLTFERSAS